MKKNNLGLISIVIPTYNRSKTILRCLDSVLDQTYQNFEIIVVDDGSTDNTKEIVKNLKDTRIRYIYQNNSGAQVARNNGIKNAKGEWIAFLDSDDEWGLVLLEKLIEKYNSDPILGCIYARAISVDENRNNTGGAPLFTLEGYIYKKGLEQGYIASTSGLMAKKCHLIDIGLFDEKLSACQDDDICFRLAKICKVGLIAENLVFAHGDADERISSSKIRVIKGWEELWDKFSHEVIAQCGGKTLSRHYYDVSRLYFTIREFKSGWRVFKKSLKYGFDLLKIIEILKLIVDDFFFQKIRYGDRRKIVILGFIKFSYKKRK